MKFRSTKELSDFTIQQWKKSGITQVKIGENLGLKQSAVSILLNPKSAPKAASNAHRIDILRMCGFEVEALFIARRIKKGKPVKS